MKPIIVLLIVFIISLFLTNLLTGKRNYSMSGRIALSAMLLFTASGHFTFTNGMSMMLPDFLPDKKGLVYLTGFIEIAAAIGLQIANYKTMTGWMLIIFFILVLPVNIFAAINHVDYQKGNHEGNGPIYLIFRIPLQIIFIIWTYMAALKVK